MGNGYDRQPHAVLALRLAREIYHPVYHPTPRLIIGPETITVDLFPWAPAYLNERFLYAMGQRFARVDGSYMFMVPDPP